MRVQARTLQSWYPSFAKEAININERTGVVFRKHNQTLFVVDDERLIAFTLCTILSQHGYRALWFTDPSLALEAMVSQTPAVVITDYDMPSMSGVALIDSMYCIDPRCRFLIFSSHSLSTHRRPRLGCPSPTVDGLAKPIAVKILISKVRALLEDAPNLPG